MIPDALIESRRVVVAVKLHQHLCLFAGYQYLLSGFPQLVSSGTASSEFPSCAQVSTRSTRSRESRSTHIPTRIHRCPGRLGRDLCEPLDGRGRGHLHSMSGRHRITSSHETNLSHQRGRQNQLLEQQHRVESNKECVSVAERVATQHCMERRCSLYTPRRPTMRFVGRLSFRRL